MNDLEVGRVVPQEELERLMPLSDVPEEPVTIEQATEQGAKDATLYFAELSQIAHQKRSSDVLKRIDWPLCRNCSDLMAAADNPDRDFAVYWEKPQLRIAEIEKYPDAYPFYRARVDISWKRLVTTDLQTDQIRSDKVPDDRKLYYGVTFYDGRWRPVYMNSKKGPDDD